VNGYCLILSNPTPRTREMTIPPGRRLGINEGVISTSQEVTIEIDPFTRLAIYYDAAGNRVLDRRTIDDINVIGEVEMIDVTVNGASIVPVEIDNSELNGSKVSRDLFSARARDLCEGITEDADRRMGGSMLVAQLSYLRSQRDGQRVGIYSPAALNLRCDDGVDTLYSLMSAGDISLTTCVGNGYNKSGALELCVRNNTDTELRVRIPQGALFEQAEWNGNQNLVVKEEQFVIIGPAKEETFPLFACCANASAGAPNDDVMNITPFIFEDLGDSFEDQSRVWHSFDGEGGRTRL